MTRDVLVTGAHGFLGRHVARHYASAGYQVSGVGHGSWGSDEARRFGLTDWHASDVTLGALMTYAGKPAIIVHCAGGGSVPFSMEQPHQDFERTVANTAAVLEYVRVHSPSSTVVYPSSAAVYGTATRVPMHESDPARPASPYGVHKQMAESLCRSYAVQYGVSLAVVRFFSVYGNGLRKQLLWDACRKASAGESEFHGSGQEVRDWLHVGDAASLVETAGRAASPDCPVLNGGSGVGTPVAGVLDMVFASYGAATKPRFGGVARAGDPSRYVADIDAARALGWAPRVPLADGVRDYVDWFKGA